MNGAIWAAIITGVVTLIGIGVSAHFSQKKMTQEFEAQHAAFMRQSEQTDLKLDAKLEKNLAVMSMRIDMLTDEVKKHNHFAERLPVLEQRVADINDRVKQLETVCK